MDRRNSTLADAVHIQLYQGKGHPGTPRVMAAKGRKAPERSARKLNLSGPRIRFYRYARGWSQRQIAMELNFLGWMIDRSGVAKIESHLV